MALDPEIEKLRHTAAHILAQAVQRLYPSAKLGIGPVTEKGYYYDFEISDAGFAKEQTDLEAQKDNLARLEAEMKQIIEEELPLTQVFLGRDEAMDMLHSRGQIFKTELLQKVDTQEVSFYKTGEEFIDLCRGPHLASTGKVGAIKLIGLMRTHWLSDDTRPIMYRISGLAFKSKKDLAVYEKTQEELKGRDHRKIGDLLEIFINEDQQGVNDNVILSYGRKVKKNIISSLEGLLEENSYDICEIKPYWNKKTFSKNELAGFYDSEDVLEVNEEEVLTNDQTIQLIELARRDIAASGERDVESMVSRIAHINWRYDKMEERPKENTGLYNSTSTQQLKGVSVVAKDKFKQELRDSVQLLLSFYKSILDETLSVVLTAKDEELSAIAIEVLMELQIDVIKQKGDSEFSLKLIHRDIFEYAWTLAEIKHRQDISGFITRKVFGELLPELKDSSTEQQGLCALQITFAENIEQFLAIILERTDGYLPLEFAAYQVMIVPEQEEYENYARSLAQELKRSRLRVGIDTTARAFDTKVKEAYRLRYPYILTVGEQEERNAVMSVKPATGEELGLMSTKEFLQKLDIIS